MTQIYLYNNSLVQGKLGFIVNKRVKNKLKTTTIFALAKEFSCHQDAIKWRDKHKIVAIVFLRVSDSINH